MQLLKRRKEKQADRFKTLLVTNGPKPFQSPAIQNCGCNVMIKKKGDMSIEF
jgi:hypothetical protein